MKLPFFSPSAISIIVMLNLFTTVKFSMKLTHKFGFLSIKYSIVLIYEIKNYSSTQLNRALQISFGPHCSGAFFDLTLIPSLDLATTMVIP